MRKSFFNVENIGYFKMEKRELNVKNLMIGKLKIS